MSNIFNKSANPVEDKDVLDGMVPSVVGDVYNGTVGNVANRVNDILANPINLGLKSLKNVVFTKDATWKSPKIGARIKSAIGASLNLTAGTAYKTAQNAFISAPTKVWTEGVNPLINRVAMKASKLEKLPLKGGLGLGYLVSGGVGLVNGAVNGIGNIANYIDMAGNIIYDTLAKEGEGYRLKLEKVGSPTPEPVPA